ncbi:MAG: LPS export ABC transporter periplasmic protein LptC [Nitrospinae bacterium]|nr:LPS export ABC transporter periplasmic protein LptC [Nitrospinota bacterium]
MRAAIFVSLAVAIALVGYFYMESGQPGGSKRSGISVSDEKITLEGVHLIQKKDNVRELELVAESAAIAIDESYTDLKKFTVVSYSEKSGKLTMNAENGKMINATKDVTASGGVLFRQESGAALITDNVNWSNSAREIRTEDEVRVFGGNFILTGKGMVVHLDEEKVEVLSNINATFYEDEKK